MMISQRQITTLAQKKRAEAITALVFMAPAMLIFMIFLIIPIGFALYFSFTDWDGIAPLSQQEQRATGVVLFTNQTDSEVIIPEGTRVLGRRLQIYQTTSTEISLPSEGTQIVEVPIEALNAPGRTGINLADIPRVCIPSPRGCQAVENVEVDNPDDLELGSAALINNSEETFVATRLRINILEPVVYTTTEEVVVPAGIGNTIEAPIIATSEFSGRKGNIAREYIAEVEGELADQVTVINEKAISNGIDPAFEFVGLENYRKLLIEDGIRRQDFFTALKNTTYFVLGVVPTQTVLALILAVILNQAFLKGRGFFRTAFYFPSITSSVVISIIFMWMFTRGGLVNTIFGLNLNWLNDSRGVFHNLLGSVGITRDDFGSWIDTEIGGLTLWNWISGPSVTLSTIMILNTWTTIGTMMVIYLAALQNIPSQVIEAAQVDGATRWQIFRHITVPLVAPTTYFVVTLGLIGTFQVFDQVYVISSGGPAKTTLTIAYIVYQNGFNNSQMGLASATALILFFIIFVFTMIQRRITPESAA